MDRVAKTANTETITAAALVTMPAVSVMPGLDCLAGGTARGCTPSRIRLSTKTW